MRKRHEHHSVEPVETEPLTRRDFAYLARLQADAYNHRSGGSFDMLAMHVKGSNFSYGKNDLFRAARTMDESYPSVCGTHCELDCYVNNPIRGGVMYVAGVRSKSGTPIDTSRPCKFCAAILDAAGVRFVVYYQEGIPTKCEPKKLLVA